MRHSWKGSISLVTATAMAGLLGLVCPPSVNAEAPATPENASASLEEIVVTAAKARLHRPEYADQHFGCQR